MPAPARVVSIPTTDAEFAAEAERIAARTPADMAPDDALHWYRLAIRRAFPTAIVRTPEDAGTQPGRSQVWYVSRHQPHFRIDNSIWVPVDAQTAWHVYVDLAPEWLTMINLTPRTSDHAVGREFDLSYSFLGVSYAGTYRILVAEPGQCVSVEIVGTGFTGWWVTTFRDQRGGTLVRMNGDYELPHNLIAQIADHLWIERSIAHDIERTNQDYRALCASLPTTPPRAKEPAGVL